MCVALVGGIDRLERHYINEAALLDVELRVFNRLEANMGTKLRHVDALVIFTGKVSHEARREAVRAARMNDIPVFMHHSCGVCTLRGCLGDIKACPLIKSGNASRRASR